MDAVSHKETTAQIRLYGGKDLPAAPAFSPDEKNAPATRGSIPDHVKKQAMDAVSNKETTAQIRLVKDNGSVSPVATPSRETDKVSEKIAQLQKGGHGVDSMHQQMTKDGFGGDRG